MTLKLKEKMNHLPLLDVLIIDDDYNLNIELQTFAKNVKKEVIEIIDFFISFLTRYNEKKIYNMLGLMLDPRFKSLEFIFFFINHE